MLNNIKRVCGFYVSSIHLITMILPYVKNQINMNAKFETILEYNFKENIDNVLSNLIINEEEKQKILNINWNNDKIQKYSNIENKLNKLVNKNQKIIK